MVTGSVLLTVLFISGALATCNRQPDLLVSAPEKMEALSGSCLQIPCNFSAKEPEKFNSSAEIFGVWIKNDSRFGQDINNVIFNGSGADNKYPISLTGNLQWKNCTSRFTTLLTSYSDSYFFRIESKPFTATASCDPVQLIIRDSPPSPRIEISGELKEKESVTVTCSAITPCPHSPPQLTWNLQQDSQNKMEENSDRTFTTKIQKTITLSDQHDGYIINCSAKYPVNQGKDIKTAAMLKTLNVSYAPKNTKVTKNSSGSLVNLTCSSRANPPISHFIWFKNSTDGATQVSEGQVYSTNPTDEGVYYCVAINNLGNQTSPHLSVTGAKQPDSILIGGIVVGVIAVVICVVVALRWLKSKPRNSQQPQSLAVKEPAAEEPARATGEEALHYGEIDFSHQKPKPPSGSVQDREPQQESMYAQVKVSAKSQTASSLTQASEDAESLYAQVKKK